MWKKSKILFSFAQSEQNDKIAQTSMANFFVKNIQVPFEMPLDVITSIHVGLNKTLDALNKIAK